MFSSGTFSKFSQALKEKFYSSFSNDMPEWSCHYSKTCIVFHSNSFYTGNHYHPLSQSAHYSVDSGPRPHKTRWLASCIFPYFSINALTEEKNPISSLPYSIPIIIKKKKNCLGIRCCYVPARASESYTQEEDQGPPTIDQDQERFIRNIDSYHSSHPVRFIAECGFLHHIHGLGMRFSRKLKLLSFYGGTFWNVNS